MSLKNLLLSWRQILLQIKNKKGGQNSWTRPYTVDSRFSLSFFFSSSQQYAGLKNSTIFVPYCVMTP